MLEASPTSRGVATEAEPAYDPYRDDARLIWDAPRALKDGVRGIHTTAYLAKDDRITAP